MAVGEKAEPVAWVDAFGEPSKYQDEQFNRPLYAAPPAAEQAAPLPQDALALAIRFHETYERLAPSFGYETRPDTRQFDPESKNGRLMVAVCGELGAPLPQGADDDARNLDRVIDIKLSGAVERRELTMQEYLTIRAALTRAAIAGSATP